MIALPRIDPAGRKNRAVKIFWVVLIYATSKHQPEHDAALPQAVRGS